MSVHNKDDSPQNAERRRFLEIAKKAGFTAAIVAASSGALLTSTTAQAAVNEEKERQKRAKYTMTIATAYIIGASRSYPIMQLDFKENIQNMTNGEVYVKLAPGGQLGAGGALAQKVQAGTIQAAQHSLSNFAPFAPAVDLINIPYWCGENQKFINLVTSDAWKQEIHPKVEAKGFKPLWYVVIDLAWLPCVKAGRPHQNAGSNVRHKVPRTGFENPATVLPFAGRKPNAGCLG